MIPLNKILKSDIGQIVIVPSLFISALYVAFQIPGIRELAFVFYWFAVPVVVCKWIYRKIKDRQQYRAESLIPKETEEERIERELREEEEWAKTNPVEYWDAYRRWDEARQKSLDAYLAKRAEEERIQKDKIEYAAKMQAKFSTQKNTSPENAPVCPVYTESRP